jgi:hypothetical protein
MNKGGGWVVDTKNSVVHIYPLDDDKEHKVAVDCPCNPEWDVSAVAFVHHSFDGRELYEEGGERKPS